jgi:hypothetical protein
MLDMLNGVRYHESRIGWDRSWNAMRKRNMLMKIATFAIAVAGVVALGSQSLILGIGEPKLPKKMDK